jgi:hypothetical protein
VNQQRVSDDSKSDHSGLTNLGSIHDWNMVQAWILMGQIEAAFQVLHLTILESEKH